MIRRPIISNCEHWDHLAMFRVQTEITFDPCNLAGEIRRRLKQDFPDHVKGISVDWRSGDPRNYLTITYPVQMICGKKLAEEDLLKTLGEIEAETLEAVRQHSLLALVDNS